MRKTFFLIAITFLFTALLVPGVLAQDDNPQQNNGYVRFANFSGEQTGVDFWVNDELSQTQPGDFGTVSDWIALPAGDYSIAAAPAGNQVGETTLGSLALTLDADQWVTVALVGSSADGTLAFEAVPVTMGEMAPGTAQVIFFNGLTGDAQANFDRDGTPFASELGPSGAPDDGLDSWTMIPVDAGTYTFSSYATSDPNTTYGDLADQRIADGSTYLIAAVNGPDGPQVVIDETTQAEAELARGTLEAPGTLVQAAQANDLLAPFAQALQTTGLDQELAGEGPYTVFAPADFAMDDLTQQYANDTEGLTTALRGYIVEGDLKFSDLRNMDSLTTLDGQTLTLREDENTVYVNDLPILTPNIAATNGTIHIIGTPGSAGGAQATEAAPGSEAQATEAAPETLPATEAAPAPAATEAAAG